MTIKDIAKMAGVSTAAVSRYFNNGYVSEEKREAIRKAVEKTGYYPSMQAKTLRTKKTNLIGVVIPRIDSGSISRVVGGITGVADENNYQLLLANTMNNPEKEIEYLSVFHEKQVDGVILLGTMITDEHKRIISNMEVPIVIVGQKLEGYNSVFHDDYMAEYEITKYLIEKGRKKLVYLGVDEADKAVGVDRYEGYREAVVEAGLEKSADRRVAGGFDYLDGYNGMKSLLDKYDDIDAVVAATDTIAAGAMKYLGEKGLRIPEDVMIVGQGDSILAKLVTPELTTVKYFYEDSGRVATIILLASINNSTEKMPVRMMKLGYEMIERGSTMVK